MFNLNSIFIFYRKKDKPLPCKRKLVVKTIDGVVTYIEKGPQHNHIIDAREVEVRMRMKTAKETAVKTGKNPRKIFGEAAYAASNEVLAKMPTQSSFNKRIHASRKGNHPKPPSSLDDVQLNNIKNSMNEQFLLWDSGEGDNRMIMFATKKSLQFLETCETLFMDGTVDSGPRLFSQLYTIHGKRIE